MSSRSPSVRRDGRARGPFTSTPSRSKRRALAGDSWRLALVSHDLRNPLNTIMLAVDFLLEEVIPDEGGETPEREHIEAIGRAARTMHRLVADLLDVTAIEAGQLRLKPAPLSADVVVQDALQLLTPLAREKEISVKAEIASPLPLLRGDRERLLQVFSNLGGNAIKFTPEHGCITVVAHAAEDCVEFLVRDTGSGIPAEDLPHVFDPFWQRRSTRQSGIGLGLAIARAIVEAHGGDIRVATEPGTGTAFSFTVPASPQTGR